MIAFSIGPIDIYRYGIFYLIGFVGAYFFLNYLWKIKLFQKFPNLQNLLTKGLDDIIIAAVLGIIIWGRLGHVLIYDLQYFITNPLKIFAIRQWGMSFIWGMTWVTIAFIVLQKIKKLNKKEFWLLIDAIITIVPLGILFGRIWNFLNQELYGIIVPQWFWWLSTNIVNILQSIHIFHIYPHIWPELRINTNILSSFFEGFISLLILLSLTRRRIKTKIFKPWQIVSIFLLRYSTIRFIIEYLRQDSQTEFIGQFSKSQRFFIAFFVLWITLFFYSKTTKLDTNKITKSLD